MGKRNPPVPIPVPNTYAQAIRASYGLTTSVRVQTFSDLCSKINDFIQHERLLSSNTSKSQQTAAPARKTFFDRGDWLVEISGTLT